MGFRRFTKRDKKDALLADEIESHLAHEQDAKIARGHSGLFRPRIGKSNSHIEHLYV